MGEPKIAHTVGSAVTCPNCSKVHSGITNEYYGAVVECDGCNRDFMIKAGLRIIKNPMNLNLTKGRAIQPQMRWKG